MTTTMDLAQVPRLSWANSLQKSRSNQHYLKPLRENQLPIVETEELTRLNQIEEELFLGLRKK